MKMKWIVSALLVGVALLGAACEPQEPVDQPSPEEVPPTQPTDPTAPPTDPTAPPTDPTVPPTDPTAP